VHVGEPSPCRNSNYIAILTINQDVNLKIYKKSVMTFNHNGVNGNTEKMLSDFNNGCNNVLIKLFSNVCLHGV